jgi:formylglycine-generating enzyme required for sulfatase activity
MTKALERHKHGKARVIPIILHPCGWLRTPLRVLQGVPRDNKAISLWTNEHAALDHVVTEIAKVVDDLRRSKTAEPELMEQASAVAVVASTPSPEPPSPPHPAPHPPADAGPSLSRRERGGVRAFKDLEVFRDVDAPWCPEMVVIPAGQFLMGSPPDEPERLDAEGPQHRVTIGYRFAIGRYAVTFAEYDHFCEVTAREKPPDQGWGRGRQPLINVSWRDAKSYAEWLSQDTGQPYRLPSEAEWEYACRTGTTTSFSFGKTISPSQVNYDGR